MKFLPSLILVLSSVGCTRRGQPAETPWVPEPAPDLGSVVARVGSVPIYAREVEAQGARSMSTPREALDELIALHLLADRAYRETPFRPDWFDFELRSALAQRLIEREVWPQVQRDSVPDQELRAIYQRAIDTFVHPRLVEAGFLILFTGAAMKPGPRAEREATAKALAATVASRIIHGPEDFEAIASDPAWSRRHVTFRRTVQGPDRPFSSEVGAAVLKLKAPGDTTPLIQDTDGFFLATYAREQMAVAKSFAQAREELRQLYYERWRVQRIEQLTREMANGHRVESHPQLLSQSAPERGS
ncbi:MAG TPA: peptidylprolyl isomerase [Polyangia bacterium]|nr:peptidylprolyl isomerase [Polyangia bacterium]